MKKVLIVVLCIIVLFIPTYIAIASYVYAQKSPVERKSIVGMTIIDLNGEAMEFDKDSGGIDGNMIDFFMKLNSAAKPVNELPEPLVGTAAYKVLYKSPDSEVTYSYYFSKNAAETYFVKDDGKAFSITEEYAKKFLLSEYAQSIYPAATAPVLTVSSSAVPAGSMSWQYINCESSYSPAALQTDGSLKDYVLSGALRLDFDKAPDYVNIVIYDDGSEIYDGLYEELTTDDIRFNRKLDVEVEAKWYENIVRGAFGEASYKFTATVASPPVFYLGQTEIIPGYFVVLTGKNVTDTSKITFSSVPDIGFTPVFFKDGEYVRALIPISLELPVTDKYVFTVKTENSTQEITLNMMPKTFLKRQYEVDASTVAKTRTVATLAKYNEVTKPFLDAEETTRYWDKVFLQPYPDARIRSGFGIIRTITSTNETYQNEGVDYMVGAGDTAPLTNAGIVVYVGELDFSGLTVIIEHGWGFKSVYFNLKSADVKVGDVLAKGDNIGTVGSTGFTQGTNLHTRLYIFDTPVCPYSLWEDGVIMTNP